MNASGIDNALDALTVGTGESQVAKIEKHPERRRKAAYEVWKQGVGKQLDDEMKGTFNKSKRDQQLREAWKASPDNPDNQVAADYNATREDLRAIQDGEKKKIETRLGSK